MPQPVPVPVPAPAPANEKQVDWDRVLEVTVALGLSLALVPVIVAALLDPEPASKLALAGLSVVMITSILATFGIEDSQGAPSEA